MPRFAGGYWNSQNHPKKQTAVASRQTPGQLPERHPWKRPTIALPSKQAPPSSRDSAPGQFIEAGDARAGAGLLHQVANQFDNTELGVHRIQHRCMREQVEARAVFDSPLGRAPNRFEEMLQLPASVAEAAHVADGTHGHVDETAGVSERLRGGLRMDNPLEDVRGGRFAGLGVRMSWVSRAHPFEAEVEEEPLHVWDIVQPVEKAAGRSEPCWRDADPLLHCRSAKLNVFADDSLDALARDEPRGALKAELRLLRLRGLDINVVVSVVAHGMAVTREQRQPFDVLLLEDAAD